MFSEKWENAHTVLQTGDKLSAKIPNHIIIYIFVYLNYIII